MILSMVVAVSDNHVIGRNNQLLWQLPKDLEFFKKVTMGHTVILGRKTYESIPHKFRPLPGRTNIVITRQAGYQAPGAVVVNDLAAAIEHAKQSGEPQAFVVGGGEIYRAALPLANRIYLTRVHGNFEGDTFFPVLDSGQWQEVSRTPHATDAQHAYAFDFWVYCRKEDVDPKD